MNQLFDFIPRKIKGISPLSFYTFLLGLVAFLYLIIFKYDGPWDWDDLTYLLAILQKRYYPILLGRSGFCYPFIAAWTFVKNFTSANFLFIENLILFSNLFLQTLTYIFTFRLLVAVKVPVNVAFVSVLLLLAELSYSVMGSRYNDTPLMQCCVVIGYYLFVLAHERRQFRYLIGSGFLAGYAILTREPAVFNLLFFPVLYIWFKKRKLNFSSKQYALSFAALATVAVSGPVLLLATYQEDYIKGFMRTAPIYLTETNALMKVKLFMESQLNIVMVVTGLLGMSVAYLKMKKNWLINFALLCMAPVVFSYILLEFEGVAEGRYYFGMFLLISVGSAFLVIGVAERIQNNSVATAFTVTALLGLMYSATSRYWPQYQKELKISRHFQEYYLEVSPLLNQKTALIFGNETVYMRYRTALEGQDAAIISAGMYWPKGHLSETINEAISRGRTVLYDPQGDRHNKKERENDLKLMREEFRITEIQSGIFKVEKK